jgi:hypothetical protein
MVPIHEEIADGVYRKIFSERPVDARLDVSLFVKNPVIELFEKETFFSPARVGGNKSEAVFFGRNPG